MIPINNKLVLSLTIVILVILVLAVAYLVLATKKAPQPQPAEETANLETEKPSTQILIDPSKELGAINPDLYGTNHRFNRHGYGMWNPATGTTYDKFNAAYDEASYKSLRYPGGTVGNLFQWKQSIGPLKERQQVYDEISDAADPADFGLDEAARFTEVHGTTMIYMYGAGNGNAGDAADLVEYLNAPMTEAIRMEEPIGLLYERRTDTPSRTTSNISKSATRCIMRRSVIGLMELRINRINTITSSAEP